MALLITLLSLRAVVIEEKSMRAVVNDIVVIEGSSSRTVVAECGIAHVFLTEGIVIVFLLSMAVVVILLSLRAVVTAV